MADPTWDTTSDVTATAGSPQSPSVPTWENTQDMQGKYGEGIIPAAKAFGLGAARTASFGTFDEFLTNTGLMKPSEIEAYKKYQPVASTAGEFAGPVAALLAPAGDALGVLGSAVKGVAGIGSAATEAATPLAMRAAATLANPETSPVINKIIAQAGSHAVGSAIEGAAYGLGQSVSEHALGDPELNAEKVIANMGTGAMWGGALGSAFGGIGGALEARANKLLSGTNKESVVGAKNNPPPPPTGGTPEIPETRVVDESGNPKVVYHGTDKSVSDLNPSKSGAMGPGFYFAEDPKEATAFSRSFVSDNDVGSGTNIRPSYLDIKNPLKIDSPMGESGGSALSKSLNDSGFHVDHASYPEGTSFYTMLEDSGAPKEQWQDIIKKAGYDGIHVDFGGGVPAHWVAFDRSQLRSPWESSGSEQVFDSPKTGVQPTEFQDIADKVGAAKQAGTATPMPQQGVLNDALGRVALDNPVHPLQMKSLEDQGSRDLYNTTKETPGKTGDALRGYEALQKNELTAKTDESISGLSPNIEPTSDATEGGNRAIQAFTDQYNSEKEALTPIFKSMKSKVLGDANDVASGVIQKMTDAVPGVAKMFDTTGADVSIKPYRTSWGIDRATYSAVKEAIESLKEGAPDFESLANIRRGLDQHVDVLSQGQAPAQIRAIKASMMDYMQDAVQRSEPDTAVRDAFKRWAINEQNRGVIEKTFGAAVGSPEFGAISRVKPEAIGDKIFSNTASVAAAKRILSPEKFNEVLSNWISENRAAATDNGYFSSNKFGSFLRKNQDALNVAFEDNPKALQRLKDLTTIARILPDAPPINPSGTAKTLFGMIKGMDFHNMTWEGMLSAIPKKILEHLADGQQFAQLNAELAGKSAAVDNLSKIERTAARTSNAIKSGAASIFNEKNAAATTRGLMGLSTSDRKENHDKIKDDISMLSSNPEQMIAHLQQNTDGLSRFAPQTAQGAQGVMMRATQFLSSKLPGNGVSQSPLSQKYTPSDSELYRFHKYFSAVEDPTRALHQIANGTLGTETMEALQSVYPKMLPEMQSAVTDKMTDHMAKNKGLPYGKKMALSLFLGQDLVNSLSSTNILANQNTLATATQAKNAQENAQMGRVNQTGLGKIDKANRMLTAQQSANQRGEA